MRNKQALRVGFRQPLALALFLSAAIVMPAQAVNQLKVELRSGPSGAKYSLTRLHDARVNFVGSQPDRNDEKIIMAFPAGFVTAEGKAIGACVFDGKVHNSVNKKLGGALKVIDGKFEVIDTRSGALLTAEFLDDVARKNGGLFQQFTIVKNKTEAAFKDKGKAVRRSIGKLVDGQAIVLESKGDVTLAQYAADAISLDVKDLLYTDLGKWGEGWIRDPASGKISNIGDQSKTQGAIQANWIEVRDGG